MATVTRACFVVLAACGELENYGGPTAPLVSFHVDVTGELDAVRPRVALVWGAQWVPERLCYTPPESPDVAAVIAAGCRDPLGFVPARVAANTELAVGTTARLELVALPAADVMVGDVTARIAYSSVVVYDDLDGDGTLDVHAPDDDSPDLIYGASFVSMHEPDQRIAFREGAYLSISAFYPRAGCGEPPRGFSVLRAGGFSVEEAVQAQLEGRLPAIDPSTCAEQDPEDATLTIALRPPAELSELACEVPNPDGSIRYRDPGGVNTNELAGRTIACAHVPDANVVEAIVSSQPDAACKEVSHFLLTGCSDGPACVDGGGLDGRWDRASSRPEWWPCE